MIPEALGLLKTLCIYMIAGCEKLQASLGLMHCGRSILSALYDTLEAAESALGQGVTAISDAYKNQQKQDALAKPFLKDAVRLLRGLLGDRWSQNGWPETGFPNQSTAVPGTFGERMLLCRSLELYFKEHPENEIDNQKITVTSARAGQLYQAMKKAAADVKKTESEQDERLAARDKAKTELRAGMQKLEGELVLVLSPSDPRWKKFGLEIPDAPSTPAPPQNVAVDGSIPGKHLVTCDAVPGVNTYRFFQQTASAAEPVLVGKSYEPMLLLDKPAPGVGVKYFVSAKSLAGRESALSQPVEVKSAAA